jgi:hypothetical protein
MTTPKYGAFESNPARFTDQEAWVYQHDNVWRKMNSAEVTQHAHVMTEANYRAAFPDAPALPKAAFQSSDKPSLFSRTARAASSSRRRTSLGPA